ncbi:restriction endonuclease subunit S [Salmonella enterica subsp. enterica]|nr:restriction endonuclease subunit S [Salmonella enterica subsp. enterica]
MSKFITVKLNELAAPGRSVISGPFGSNIGQRFFKTHGVPIIRGNNLTTDFKKFNDDGFVFLTEEKADELKSDAIKGDILFTAAGTIGQVGMIPQSAKYDRYVISNKQLRFRVDPEKADPDYVYYWLASPWIYKTIIDRNTGSTVPLINLGIIKSLPVSLPKDIIEQKKIASVLANIDEKIALNNRINAELEAMAKTLYDYWFVQFDFPDANGKPYKTSGGKMEYNATLKREIPAGWDNCKLKDIISMEYGKPLKAETRSGDGYPVFGSSGIVGFHHDYLVEGPGIVIGRKGTVGKVNYTFDNFYPIDTAYYVNSKISMIFLNFLISSMGLERMNSDSAVPGLNREATLGLPIVNTPLNLILKYHACVEAGFEKKRLIQKENNNLETLRDWLLPLLMNGQVTVK